MKKTLKFSGILILALLFMTVLSCEKETLLPEEQVQSIQENPLHIFKAGFSLKNFEDPTHTIKDNIRIQWENYTSKTIAGLLWYEFSVTQQQKVNMVSEFQEDNQYRLLASLDKDNTPHYFIAKLAPQKWITASQAFSYLNPEGFSGTVSLYNLQGEVAFLEYYKKGQVQNSVQDISVKGELITPVSNKCMQKGTARPKCDTSLECMFALAEGESTDSDCGTGGNAGGSYVAVRTDHYTDWYNIRGDGTADYSHTQFNGSTYEYVYVTNTTYSSGYQNSYSYYNYTGLGEYGTGQEDDDGYYSDDPPVAEEPDRVILVPPSCHSFNFQTTTESGLWQSAAVKNIGFKVYYITEGQRAFHKITFPQPILFEMPTNMIIGGDISAGLAAELSAQAVKLAMDETVHHFKNIYATETTMRLYFEERLKINYPLVTNGGRVNIHPTSYNIIPTEYVTTIFGTGKCQ